MRRKRSDRSSLGQTAKDSTGSATATVGQGDLNKFAEANVTTEEEIKQTPESNGIEEAPNESSLLGLEEPRRQSVRWAPPDLMRLVVVSGLLVLITLALFLKTDVLGQLMPVFGLVVGYRFGKGDRPAH